MNTPPLEAFDAFSVDLEPRARVNSQTASIIIPRPDDKRPPFFHRRRLFNRELVLSHFSTNITSRLDPLQKITNNNS